MESYLSLTLLATIGSGWLELKSPPNRPQTLPSMEGEQEEQEDRADENVIFEFNDETSVGASTPELRRKPGRSPTGSGKKRTGR